MANLRSVQKRFSRSWASRPRSAAIRIASRIVTSWCCRESALSAMPSARLTTTGLSAPIKEHIERGKKFLGICLGMQLPLRRQLRGRRISRPGSAGLARWGVRFPDMPGHEGAAHGLEPVADQAARRALWAETRRRRCGLFRPLVLSTAARCKSDRGRKRLSYAVRRRRRGPADNILRDAVSSGEEQRVGLTMLEQFRSPLELKWQDFCEAWDDSSANSRRKANWLFRSLTIRRKTSGDPSKLSAVTLLAPFSRRSRSIPIPQSPAGSTRSAGALAGALRPPGRQFIFRSLLMPEPNAFALAGRLQSSRHAHCFDCVSAA